MVSFFALMSFTRLYFRCSYYYLVYLPISGTYWV
nr:MAG TPA: hypothetical protein [Caudoviricetes sp.]